MTATGDGDIGGDPAQKIDELSKIIRYHDERYYADDAPEISDADYDALMRELRALEEAHPELASEDSPTRRVATGLLSTTFAPVQHLSLIHI